MISPILGNIYLHYVLDRWAHRWRRKQARGAVYVVRYADDSVLGFQYRDDGERFRRELGERLAKFGLSLNERKTRLLEFGRFAADNRRKRGAGKPETFDFLGFTCLSAPGEGVTAASNCCASPTPSSSGASSRGSGAS